MEKEYVNELLTELINKFQRIEAYDKEGNIEATKRMIETITDEEIQAIDNLASTFKEMSENIKFLKKQVNLF